MPIGLPQLSWLMRAARGLKTAGMGLRKPATMVSRRLGRAGSLAGRKFGWMRKMSVAGRRDLIPEYARASAGQIGRYAMRGIRQAWRATPRSSRYLLAGGAGVAAGMAYGARRRPRYY